MIVAARAGCESGSRRTRAKRQFAVILLRRSVLVETHGRRHDVIGGAGAGFGRLYAMMRQYELVERVRRYNPRADEDLLDRAYVFAMKAHGSQKRASGAPYFSHPLEVAAILTELKVDDATIVAAMLHDTIEDTTVTREEVDKAFGEEIGGLVDGLTKLGKLDFVTKHAEQAENFRKLLLAIADDARVLLVKLADRLHNMRTLQFMPADKRARIAEDTLDIYAPLAGRMGMQSMRNELEDLAFRCLMPDAYKLIVTRLEAMKAKNGAIIARIAAELTDQFARRGIRVEVKGRQKQPYSIWRKMERRSIAFEQLSISTASAFLSTRSPIATPRSGSRIRLGQAFRDASRTISRPRSKTITARSTPRSSGRAASGSNCRSARTRCTKWPSMASPRTPFIKTRGSAPTCRGSVKPEPIGA